MSPEQISLGWHCLLNQALVRKLSDLLTRLQQVLPCDRMRLYLFSPATACFQLILERGGVASNHRRVQIPLMTDELSQVLVHEKIPLVLRHWEVDEQPAEVEIYHFKGSANEEQKLPYRGIMAHNDPALERGGLGEWLDLPLLSGNRVIGKLTMDNMHTQEILPAAPPDLESYLCELSGPLESFLDGHNSFEQLTPPDPETCSQALRQTLLHDQFRTILTQMRGERIFEWTRARVYLESTLHRSMFGRLMQPGVEPGRGFYGQVELGGVPKYFPDAYVPSNDEPSGILLEDPEVMTTVFPDVLAGDIQKAHDLMLNGEPMIFTKQPERHNLTGPSLPYVFRVNEFFKVIQVHRGKLREHLDLPIVAPNKEFKKTIVLGKITFDRKWLADDLIGAMTADDIARLKYWARRFACAINHGRDSLLLLTSKELAHSVRGAIGPLGGVFLG